MSFTSEQLNRIEYLLQDSNGDFIDQGLVLLESLLDNEAQLMEFLRSQMEDVPEIKDTTAISNALRKVHRNHRMRVAWWCFEKWFEWNPDQADEITRINISNATTGIFASRDCQR